MTKTSLATNSYSKNYYYSKIAKSQTFVGPQAPEVQEQLNLLT